MTLILFAGLVLWLGHVSYSSILCLNFRVKAVCTKYFYVLIYRVKLRLCDVFVVN